MARTERRRDQRIPLHLAVSGAGLSRPVLSGWTTENVSPGGMYVRVPAAQAPPHGGLLDFVLAIPPGQGHSPHVGSVHGSGRVQRVDRLPDGLAGLAVQFTVPPAVDFLAVT